MQQGVDAGFLLVNKPQGLTSYDVVAKVSRLYDRAKVGHGGTLDPLATGLLVLALGSATKFLHHFLNDDKEYLAQFRLGQVTDTQDATGKIISEHDVKTISIDDLQSVCALFHGTIDQLPPMFSAKKVKGKRLYALARKGKDVERDVKQVDIKALDIIRFDGRDGEMMVCCSKGTYIRTLCHDIGMKLGVGAHMTGLVRTRSGRFLLKQAMALDELLALDKAELRRLLLPVADIVKS